jgi:hypothetical protein
MSVLFTYKTKVIVADEELIITSRDISMMSKASIYQISAIPESATAGTVEVKVKAINSNLFENLTRGGNIVYIMLDDPETINPINGVLEAVKITSTGADGSFFVSITGWD